MLLLKTKCPVCGVEFIPDNIRRIDGNEAEVTCPNGHVFTILVDRESVLDCEIRDWDRFAVLPSSMQNAVLEVIRSGRVPSEMVTLMRRLKEAGIVVCT
ncbi:MAG: hypothetical protein ABWK05_02665 [Pyrobaculum sp.]